MPICDDKLKEFISDLDEYSRLEDVAVYEQEQKRLNKLVRDARTKGYYNDPAKRLFNGDTKLKDLVGKTISVNSNDTYTFEDIVVESAEMIDHYVANINGDIRVNTLTGMTLDGNSYVELGSEANGKLVDVHVIPIRELNGTVMSLLDNVVADMNNVDGNALSDEHKAHLNKVFDMYKNALTAASTDVELNLKFFEDFANRNTRGTAIPGKKEVNIVLGNNRHHTGTEILAHEIMHILLAKAIEDNPKLRMEIETARVAMRTELTKKYGEGYKVFLEGIENVTTADVTDAKAMWDYVFDKSTAPADEFLAYATTNEKLVNGMGGIKGITTTTDADGNVVQIASTGSFDTMSKFKQEGWFWRFVNGVIDIINKVFTPKNFVNGSGKDVAMDLLDKVLKVEYKTKDESEKSAIHKMMDKIDVLDEKLSTMSNKIQTNRNDYAMYLTAEERGATAKAINKIWKIRALAKAKSWLLQNNLFGTVVRNTDNKEIKKFFRLFRQGKNFVEKEVNAIKSVTATVVSRDYAFGKMDKNKREIVKMFVMDLDGVALGNADIIQAYLKNPDMMDTDIESYTRGLKKSTVMHMEALADLLVTNTPSIMNGYVNAHQIAFMEEGMIDIAQIKRIDKAVTLMAMRKVPAMDRDVMISAIEENANGINSVMTLKDTDDRKMLKQAYRGNAMYSVKGAKQERFDIDKTYHYVNEEGMKKMVKAKGVNVGKQNTLSEIVGFDVYVVVADNLDSGYTEGLLKTVQMKNEGDNLRGVLKKLKPEMTDEDITYEIMALASMKSKKESIELVPERTGTGIIYDYRIRMSSENKRKYMGQDNDIVVSIAETVGNLTHKQEAMTTNINNLRYMKRFYEQYKDSGDMHFIEISKDSTGKEKEYWDIIPMYVKNEINKTMKGKLYVEESLLVNYFGHKNASVANAVGIKNSKKIQLAVKKIERVLVEAASTWKKHVVAHNPKTISANIGSNMIVALEVMKNKDPLNYAETFKKVWGWFNQYQENRTKLLSLKVKRDAGEKVDAGLIKGLEATLDSNPISVIMNDGQFTSMLEDINSEFFSTKGPMQEMIDGAINKIKKDSRRESVMAMVDLLYVRDGSSISEPIMKLTTYADAINKMIILMDMQENSKNKVITQEMLDFVDSLHVNYSYLDNKYIKYMNDIMVIVFTKYLFRAFPPLMRLAARKPATLGVVEGLQGVTGLDLATPADAYFTPVDSITSRFGGIFDFKDILSKLTIPWIMH